MVEKKSMLLAYILWFFLGLLGVHRFYLGKGGTGALMLILCLIGGALAMFGIGFIFLIPLGIWWLLDAILVYVNCSKINKKAEEFAYMQTAMMQNTVAMQEKILNQEK